MRKNSFVFVTLEPWVILLREVTPLLRALVKKHDHISFFSGHKVMFSCVAVGGTTLPSQGKGNSYILVAIAANIASQKWRHHELQYH